LHRWSLPGQLLKLGFISRGKDLGCNELADESVGADKGRRLA